MTAPFSVEIGDEVDPGKISSSLTIYGAARIYGKNTLIAPHVKLGYEAPVTLIDCQLASDVELRGGYFADSVFLKKAVMGSNAQVRSGCLLEEESGGNHSVGLKQTILFPFVQLGSLVNFCDCLMAGGTSRKNHSEVGSSYIHFNYTPQQDKATASLIGDVPRGVMLREPPIFLGGQGGLVGPAKIEYGTVIPAGIIYRQNRTKIPLAVSSLPFNKFLPGFYGGDINGKVNLSIEYLANLLSLRQWYLHVRRDFFLKEENGDIFYERACNLIDGAINERIKQLNAFAGNLETSLAAESKRLKKSLPDKIRRSQKQFLQSWPRMEAYLLGKNEEKAGSKKRDSFVTITKNLADRGNSYLDAIRSLNREEAQKGTGWLKDTVDGIIAGCRGNLHAQRQKEK